jgi:hypothetical protein
MISVRPRQQKEMAMCNCDSELRSAFHSLECLDCGSPLCPSCAISLESTTYCGACAAQLLETPHVRAVGSFELH